jgi:hypothetical protein
MIPFLPLEAFRHRACISISDDIWLLMKSTIYLRGFSLPSRNPYKEGEKGAIRPGLLGMPVGHSALLRDHQPPEKRVIRTSFRANCGASELSRTALPFCLKRGHVQCRKSFN